MDPEGFRMLAARQTLRISECSELMAAAKKITRPMEHFASLQVEHSEVNAVSGLRTCSGETPCR